VSYKFLNKIGSVLVSADTIPDKDGNVDPT
jgi:hypothetical protein